MAITIFSLGGADPKIQWVTFKIGNNVNMSLGCGLNQKECWFFYKIVTIKIAIFFIEDL